MEKFLALGQKRKAAAAAAAAATTPPPGISSRTPTLAKTRRFDDAFVGLGFTSVMVGAEERPQCLLCLKVLAVESLKPNKLKLHLETTHPEHKTSRLIFLEKSF